MGLMWVTAFTVFPVVASGGGVTNGTHGVEFVGKERSCASPPEMGADRFLSRDDRSPLPD